MLRLPNLLDACARLTAPEKLPQPARWVGGGRNVRSRRRCARVGRDFGRGRVRQPNSCIHLQVFLRAARTIGLASIFVAQAGELVATVDAVTVTRCRGSFDRHQSHKFSFAREILPSRGETRKHLKQCSRAALPRQASLSWNRRYGLLMFSRNSSQVEGGIARNTSTTFGSNCVP